MQSSVLLVASAVSLAFLRRAVPLALSNPNGFPAANWGWPEKVFSSGLIAFFLLMAAASAGHPSEKVDMGGLGTSLVLYVAMVLLVSGFLIFRNFDLRQTFGLNVRGWNALTIAGWLLMFLPLVYFVQSLSYALSGPDQSPQAIVDFLLQSKGWQARAVVFGIAVIAAPVTEELIFRGCLYGVLRKSNGRALAIVVSSLLFALIHGHLPSLPGLFVLAVGLSLVYERCGSLWAPISMHAAFNGLTILTALLWPELGK
ncbi:MAG: CPBP family intramembrane glutamic endopeptidase [Terrimicrobiaceae bacterium]